MTAFLTGLAIFVGLWLGAAILATRYWTPLGKGHRMLGHGLLGHGAESDPIQTRERTEHTGAAGDTLHLVTWNLGFGALGRAADFFADGGRSLRALGQKDIELAAANIARRLRDFDADLFLLQENARGGFLTRGVDLVANVNGALSDYWHAYLTDIKTRLMPRWLRIDHGLSTLSRRRVTQTEILRLPQEPKRWFGLLRKYYVGLVTRLPIAGQDGSWVIINLHLAAFDEGAKVRAEQLARVVEFARKAHDAGNWVVIGGDWNLRLTGKPDPASMSAAALAWLHDLPENSLPKGWNWAVDRVTPTVRTLKGPYEPGKSFTGIIDGYMVSPNVEVLKAQTFDLGFADTDHHPVTAQFRARIAA